ncbi:MAG: 3-hydroxyacyl-CoA dehydrogenase/enoyl-CoA hydratase family protein [Saprospiraceae bacterium]|nr:3-hydroxyacyl-CoA dehydrogenase/enoyl-CoA hydratase family protein [Saprospiraceae bacterium]MBK7436330.1 3-hydroxyacyl-CoA dehydrogenase/enoyl-CoA hydratase family protein [Saprospiraceae bacterium]MBK9679996.1 3-hydroxyacyl-CoA dehydrogenase/enoyl-CoA hydratase family protein [Saprospiraceae bacterium]MBP7802662.1 3-hydroxyacyl-CoA dehydrogenase/enoyl-CoA hydratase family protein [Saprospiraceae bacterium]MBP8095255.1 3-hydroxyacyl-CoA dehydrogenase/enoyl-CoA hydratase family protein [Sapr
MYRISKVAVLGSGVMGSGIACHLANCGYQVLMLDIVPFDLTEAEKGNKKARNKIVDTALLNAVKTKPAPLFHKSLISNIKTGNFDDDLALISECDWIIEVIVERLDIKKSLFDKVEKYRKPGTLISSNTSGIPIHLMAEGRSEDFKAHFLGTHFFNPPRYLRLLEIIPTQDTNKAVVDFFMKFGDVHLGKRTVLCKDTPAFIANRIGVYAMSKIYQLTEELNLDISTVDKLTGPAMGRPGTGTFRLSDLVGLDTAVKVIEGIQTNCTDDEQIHQLKMPSYLTHLVENKWLGNKSGKGFYYKSDEKDAGGKNVIYSLNLKTLEYEVPNKTQLASLGVSKQTDELGPRLKAIITMEDAGAQLIKRSLAGLFAYASNRIPEISDNIYSIDDALKAGFAWDLGPFEYWDAIGLSKGIELAESDGQSVAPWVKEMVEKGHTSFYTHDGSIKAYDPGSKSYLAIPGRESLVNLFALSGNKPVYQNPDAVIHDIGDGVLCVEFKSKANTIGEGVVKAINEGISIAEEGKWQGLVIGNHGKNFSVGANLMMIAMSAYQQEWDELNFAVKTFQDTTMRCRYSKIPVVIATQGYVFGGGCETLMHCDAALCAAESYIGLVEAGVGLIPGGGGTKEFAVRASDSFFEGDVMIPTLVEKFKTIAMAAVGTSATEAFDLGYLLKNKDSVVLNADRNITEAKAKVLELAPNYTMPIPREDVLVLGQQGLASLYIAAHSLKLGNYASAHDIKIAKKAAWVLCGGDLSGPQKVSERYLLDVEREAFLSLCGEQKTLERIQYMLENNKPLRN